TRLGGGLARGSVGVGGFGGRALVRGLVLGRRVLGRGVLGRRVLGRGVLGRRVLGRSAPGGLGRLARGLTLLGRLAGLALLGRGLEALLLVRARFGGAQGAFAPRFPGELL